MDSRHTQRMEKKFINFRTIQFSWPLGMPLVRKIDTNLWAGRSKLTNGIARVFFTVKGNTIILLHGFIKKSQKTPIKDLSLAKEPLKQLRSTTNE